MYVQKSLFNNTQGRTRSFHFDKLVNLSKWHFRETLFVRLRHSKAFKIVTKYTDRNFVDNFLQVVIYLALVANI